MPQSFTAQFFQLQDAAHAVVRLLQVTQRQPVEPDQGPPPLPPGEMPPK